MATANAELQDRIEQKFTPPEQRKPVTAQPPAESDIDARLQALEMEQQESSEPEDTAIESASEAVAKVEEVLFKNQPEESEPEVAPEPLPPSAVDEPIWSATEAAELAGLEQYRSQLTSDIDQYNSFVEQISQLPEGRERLDAIVRLQVAEQHLNSRIDMLEKADTHVGSTAAERLRERDAQHRTREREKVRQLHGDFDEQALEKALLDQGFTQDEIKNASARELSIAWKALGTPKQTVRVRESKSSLDKQVEAARREMKRLGTYSSVGKYRELRDRQRVQKRAAKQTTKVWRIR